MNFIFRIPAKRLYLLFFSVIGCSTYQLDVEEARHHMADGRPFTASKLLSPMAEKRGRNQILYMLDYGLSLHQSGDIKKSNKVFMTVDRLAEVKDYVSLSRQAGSLFFNQSLIPYKSERFENLLINAYLALNFTLLGKFEDALVECRRMDEKLRRMKLENEDVRKNFYSRYLSAMIWQDQGNWDSAYIDYYKAYTINPGSHYLKRDLIRAAWQAGRISELRKWQKKFPGYSLNRIKKEVQSLGELVFIYQQGWIHRKQYRLEDYRFPELVPVPARFHRAVLEIDGKKRGITRMLYPVSSEAKRVLDNDYKYLVAKKILGAVAKEVVAHQVRQENQFLGTMTSLILHASDRADLRQWSTLPNSFQLFRLALKPGIHRVVVWGQGFGGEKKIWEGQVRIARGKKTFLTKRSF